MDWKSDATHTPDILDIYKFHFVCAWVVGRGGNSIKLSSSKFLLETL